MFFCSRDAAVVQNAAPVGRAKITRGAGRGGRAGAGADNRKGYMAHIMQEGEREASPLARWLAAFQKPHSQCLLDPLKVSSFAPGRSIQISPAYGDTVCNDNLASVTLLLGPEQCRDADG